MKYDIADVLETRNAAELRKMMQEDFEYRIGQARSFRITGTPVDLGQVAANLEDSRLTRILSHPPNPHGRQGGWDAKPLPPLKRTSWGFENDRIDFHHMKFIRNGHLEFWTGIDKYFCWQQDPEEMKEHPRLYPYAVVEHVVSFVRLYRALVDFLGIESDTIFQMQYLNIRGAILLPYQPESIGFMAPVDPIRPLGRSRLLFEPKQFQGTFDPDPSALDIIEDVYHEFGYSREQIPFFDQRGKSTL
jgi:hypothetical protein